MLDQQLGRGDKWMIGGFPKDGKLIYFVQQSKKSSVSWSSTNGNGVETTHKTLEADIFGLGKHLVTTL